MNAMAQSFPAEHCIEWGTLHYAAPYTASCDALYVLTPFYHSQNCFSVLCAMIALCGIRPDNLDSVSLGHP